MKAISEDFTFMWLLLIALTFGFGLYSEPFGQEQTEKAMNHINDSWNSHMMQPKWRWFK